MTDKTEWLDWACLDWTGVEKWTGEWPRSSHSPSIVESGQSSNFLAICCVVWLFWVPPDGGTTGPLDQRRLALARA